MEVYDPLDDGTAPPASVLYVLHDVNYEIAFGGDHSFNTGDVISLVRHDNNGCEGAASPYRDRFHGGTLDETRILHIKLQNGLDGTEFMKYVMCLADVSSYDPAVDSSLTDSDFNFLDYVQFIVSYQPPSAPPPSPRPAMPPSP